MRRVSFIAVTVLLAASLASPALAARPPHAGGGGGDTTSTVAVPSRMASLGDSITRAFNACGWYVDCTSRSWSTGSASDAVTSHFERLRSIDSTMSSNLNYAKTGAKAADLPGQAASAAGSGAGYVTILMGANDACTSTEAGMTSVSAFRSSFASALQTLNPDENGPQVFVASIPDVHRLWEVGHVSWSARNAWNSFDICQSLLANPTSTDEADVARRGRVQERVADYNAAMAEVCAAYANCHWDGGAVFSYPFALSDLSGWDYFHPDEGGQAILAEQTWKATGIDWAAASKGGGKGGGKNK